MESKTKITGAGRRRSSNRHAGHYRTFTGRASSGQPVHIGIYLNSLLDENGNPDRKKIVERFNTESYG